jgi:hypothetical protein
MFVGELKHVFACDEIVAERKKGAALERRDRVSTAPGYRAIDDSSSGAIINGPAVRWRAGECDVTAKDMIAIIKDSAAGLREVLLVALLLVLLFNPPVITGWLASSGLDKFSAFGFSVETRKAAEASREQNLAVANNLQAVEARARAAEQNVERLQAALERTLAGAETGASMLPAAASPSASARPAADPVAQVAQPAISSSPPATPPATAAADPALRRQLKELSAQVDSLAADLGSTRAAAQRAQAQTRAAVVTQSRIVERAGGTIRREGWVWVGQIDPASGRLRDVGVPETVVAPVTLDPGRLAGSALRFSALTDIYREPFDGASAPSAIVGVATPADTAKVIEARLVRFAREGLTGRGADDRILWARIGPD